MKFNFVSFISFIVMIRDGRRCYAHCRCRPYIACEGLVCAKSQQCQAKTITGHSL